MSEVGLIWGNITIFPHQRNDYKTVSAICCVITNPSCCILRWSSSAFLLVSTNISVLLWLSAIMFSSSFCNLQHTSMHMSKHYSHTFKYWRTYFTNRMQCNQQITGQLTNGCVYMLDNQRHHSSSDLTAVISVQLQKNDLIKSQQMSH